MAFTALNSGLVVPEYYAQPLGEVAGVVSGQPRGFETVAEALNTLFLFKQGAMALDYDRDGYPLRLTTDRRLYVRCKTPIWAGWTASTWPRVRLYTVVQRASGASTWRISIYNPVKGTTQVFKVASGAATTGIQIVDEGAFDISDTSSYNEFQLYISAESGTAGTDKIYGFALIPERAHKTTLAQVLGGYNRGVNPLDLAVCAEGDGAYVDVIRDAHAMALDIWQHRTGQILSSPRAFTHPSPGSYAMSHRFMQWAPAGVVEAFFTFRTGAAVTTTFRARAISGDGTVEEETSATVGANSWGSLTLAIPTPSWGGDVELQIEATQDYESACGWWYDGAYTRSRSKALGK